MYVSLPFHTTYVSPFFFFGSVRDLSINPDRHDVLWIPRLPVRPLHTSRGFRPDALDGPHLHRPMYGRRVPCGRTIPRTPCVWTVLLPGTGGGTKDSVDDDFEVTEVLGSTSSSVLGGTCTIDRPSWQISPPYPFWGPKHLRSPEPRPYRRHLVSVSTGRGFRTVRGDPP